MTRIAVLAPGPVPPTTGGYERLFEGIVDAINTRPGYHAELLTRPSPESTLAQVLASYRLWSELKVDEFDEIVCGKYPCWMVDHPRVTIYLQHRLRGLYDTYPGVPGPTRGTLEPEAISRLYAFAEIPPQRERLGDLWQLVDDASQYFESSWFAHPGPLGRALVHWLDAVGFDPSTVHRYLANSARVRSRTGYFPTSAVVDVVHPPSSLKTTLSQSRDHFFTVSRHDSPKRLDLIIRAYQKSNVAVPLIIGGEGPDTPRLKDLADSVPGVQLVGRVGDEALADLYARAIAVPFVPYDEDFGLIGVEAMASGRPIISCIDSGGITELVTHGRNGIICPPDSGALAASFELLANNLPLADRLGTRAKASMSQVTWDGVVDALLGTTPVLISHNRSDIERKRVTILTTYPVFPPRHGGQLRCARLAEELSVEFDVHIVSMGHNRTAGQEQILGPWLRETTVAPSAQATELDDLKRIESGFAVTDIIAPELVHATPDLLAAIHASVSRSNVVVLEQPFLSSLMSDLGVPFIYDSQNAEHQLKADLLPIGKTRDRLLVAVRVQEGFAYRESAAVMVCTDGDGDVLERQYGPTFRTSTTIPNGHSVSKTTWISGAKRRQRSIRLTHELSRIIQISGTTSPRGCLYTAVFVGSNHPPNVAAARAIIELARAMPYIYFALVGGHVDSLRAEQSIPVNVGLIGMVSDADLKAILSSCSIALNPVETGSGTNLKIIEYLSYGIPTVTTPDGARGLGLVDDQHVVVAPLVRFESSIHSLLTDHQRADRLGEGGRRHVEQHFDWSIIGARLRDVVRTVVSTHQ